MRPFTRVKDTSFNQADFGIRWFADGTLNLSANCLDRQLAERGDTVAIHWEPDNPAEPGRTITYGELHEMVCRFANVLKVNGAGRGSRVTIYMPMIPEAAVAMLACARVGAIHSVVFGGFSPEALAGRIQDCEFDCWSSPPTRASAAASPFRSRPMSTRRWSNAHRSSG